MLGDDWIVNDGGLTTILVNGVKLHDGLSGTTRNRAVNGEWHVAIRGDGQTVDRTDPDNWTISPRSVSTIGDRDFSAADFTETPIPTQRRQDPDPDPEPDPTPTPPPPASTPRPRRLGRRGERRVRPWTPAWAAASGSASPPRPAWRRRGRTAARPFRAAATACAAAGGAGRCSPG